MKGQAQATPRRADSRPREAGLCPRRWHPGDWGWEGTQSVRQTPTGQRWVSACRSLGLGAPGQSTLQTDGHRFEIWVWIKGRTKGQVKGLAWGGGRRRLGAGTEQGERNPFLYSQMLGEGLPPRPLCPGVPGRKRGLVSGLGTISAGGPWDSGGDTHTPNS